MTAPDKVLGATERAAVMARLGIECVPVDYFHWKGFRYTSLEHAVAAAERASEVGRESG